MCSNCRFYIQKEMSSFQKNSRNIRDLIKTLWAAHSDRAPNQELLIKPFHFQGFKFTGLYHIVSMINE